MRFPTTGMCDQQILRSACAYAQSDQSLCLSLEYSMSVKLLTGHRLEFLCFKRGCTGSSESKLVKMPHCWKSHVVAHMFTTKNKEDITIIRGAMHNGSINPLLSIQQSRVYHTFFSGLSYSHVFI